jgi:hypothetical protein
MRSNYTPFDEVAAHRHPILLGSEYYRISRIQHDANLESGVSILILHLLHRETGERRVLSFTGGGCDHPLKHCIGLYLMDIRYRGWEDLRVEVGEFYEEGGVFFYATDVRDITDETPVA